MEQDLLDRMISIGLTEGEAKTYLALLSLGSSKVGPIIEKSDVSASKVYQILDRLMHKGLVTMSVYEKNKFFSAAEPTRILDYLDNEKKKIDENKNKISDILPRLSLKKGTAEKKPIVEIAIGKKGFETIYSEIIESAKPNSFYFGLGGYKSSFNLQSFWYPYSLKLDEKRITHSLIYEHKVWYEKDPKIHRRKERKNYYPLVLNEKYYDLPNIITLGDKAIITGVDENEEIFSLIIRNKHLSEAFRKLLYLIKDFAKVPEGFKKL